MLPKVLAHVEAVTEIGTSRYAAGIPNVRVCFPVYLGMGEVPIEGAISLLRRLKSCPPHLVIADFACEFIIVYGYKILLNRS